VIKPRVSLIICVMVIKKKTIAQTREDVLHNDVYKIGEKEIFVYEN